MKKQVNTLAKADIATLKSTANRKLMAALLSPLEEQVMKRGAQPFTYQYNGIPVYISSAACRQLISNVNYKMEIMSRLVGEEHERAGIPLKIREVLDDPREVLSLHPILRNRLCKVEIYTLGKMIKLGRNYFASELNLKASQMTTLDALFAKYRITHLFTETKKATVKGKSK